MMQKSKKIKSPEEIFGYRQSKKIFSQKNNILYTNFIESKINNKDDFQKDIKENTANYSPPELFAYAHYLFNNKNKDDPKKVLTVKTYKDNIYSNEVEIKDDQGKVIARLIYSPEKPLSCGAKVWLECDSSNVTVK